jgi:hypothetical protein
MNKELARRAVACKSWRWLPGMLTLEEIVPPAITLGWDAARVLHADEGEAVRVCTVLGKVRDIHATALPDLTDPATVGALLALVREAWGGCDTYLYPGSGEGDWWCSAGDQDFHATTEAEALVAALEAAP